jgi:hypothetical protein
MSLLYDGSVLERESLLKSPRVTALSRAAVGVCACIVGLKRKRSIFRLLN